MEKIKKYQNQKMFMNVKSDVFSNNKTKQALGKDTPYLNDTSFYTSCVVPALGFCLDAE